MGHFTRTLSDKEKNQKQENATNCYKPTLHYNGSIFMQNTFPYHYYPQKCDT